MAKKKLSTSDILAQLRSKDSGSTSDAPATEGASSVEEPAASKEATRPAASNEAQQAEKKITAAPKSTKDILAALRGQTTEGRAKSAPAPEAAKAKKKESPKPSSTAKPAAEQPSVQEMLKAVREGRPVTAAESEPAEAAPARPKKPTAVRKSPAKKKAAAEPTRRNALLTFLLMPLILVANPFNAAWTFFSAATGAFTLALARFMMPNVLVEPPSRFKVGSPGDYPFGTVTTKWKARYAVWIVHSEFQGRNLIYALSSVCTHLGCTPNWLEGEQKFKCPCHGSGFYRTGVNFEGPAPRPLERHGIRLAEDGMLEVDKSVKFQQEMGQWDDPSCFVELV
jgi:cytochrome b6-f complex iron-sulfur subunit